MPSHHQDDAGDRPRAGEVWLPSEPSAASGGAALVFIGRVRSTWTDVKPPPRNPGDARQRRETACLEVDAPYRPALEGLAAYSHILVLVWLHRADRRPLVITPPRASEARGVFALRSPVRPNPIGLSVCRLLDVDKDLGLVRIDAIDFLDDTPLVDIKPYRPGIDAIPDAVVG